MLNSSFVGTSIDCPRFIMLDNPGCDEYGSAVVFGNIKRSQILSSAFIVVTSLESYRSHVLSHTLKKLHSKNPGMHLLPYSITYVKVIMDIEEMINITS